MKYGEEISMMSTRRIMLLIAAILIGVGMSSGVPAAGAEAHYYAAGQNDLRSVATKAGYNDGIKQGRSDRTRRLKFQDPNTFVSYRLAKNGYTAQLGPIKQYKTYYRQAFKQGYLEGYNGQ
jgi:hypothetical protein